MKKSSRKITAARLYKPKSTPPNTTEEQQTVTAGQRIVNLLWENTQASIAKAVVYTSLAVNSVTAVCILVFKVEMNSSQTTIVTVCLQPISLITGIIIGFYFSRTNHSAIGGVGSKPESSNIGTR